MIEELLNANDWKPIAGNTYYPLLLFIITIVVIVITIAMTIVIIMALNMYCRSCSSCHV